MECDSESISVKYVKPISHSNMFNWTKLRTGHTNVVKTNKKVIVNKSDPEKKYLNCKPYGIRILASLKIVHNEKRRETI